MESENEGLRRHIDNRAEALDTRLQALECNQRETQAAAHNIGSLERAQTRIYEELGEIKRLCLKLDAIGITERLSEIQTTQREHGETLREHTVQLAQHETDIQDINSRAIADLTKRVSELEKADGRKALKALSLIAGAVITTLVGMIMGAAGIFGG